jgi:hypothetical protein
MSEVTLESLEDQALRAVLNYARQYPDPPAYKLEKGGTYTFEEVQRQSDFHFLIGIYVTIDAFKGSEKGSRGATQELYADVAGARNFLKMEEE